MYPDRIEIKSQSDFEKDDELNIIPKNGKFIFLSNCRIEKNTSGKTIQGTDGGTYVYSYIIYMPLHIIVIPKRGDIIKIIKENGTLREETKVADFSKGKFNCRLWV